MKTFVADTHALVWHLTDPRLLGKAARRAFAAADEGRWTCHVPAISLVEVALPKLLDTIAGHPGYTVLPLDVEQAIEFAALVSVRDPMDRMIVAAARVTASELVSKDEALDGCGVALIWD